MSDPRPRTDPRFSTPDAPPIAWATVVGRLTEAELYWCTTVRTDGRPHTTPLVGVWVDDAFALTTGDGEQKQVNLRSNPAVTVVAGGDAWAAGLDVVVEGRAERLAGRTTIEPVAAAYREKYGARWGWQATDEGVTMPGAPADPFVYVVRPTKVLAFAKDPHQQVAFDL
ncbi:MAG: pyridoxamine-phosphate oxidase [Nocardioides sp.]|nr:pyridoxamine-phosphate oxidase [Nocardioides sp.]